MARKTITIDERIERAQEAVIKAKERYDNAVNELKELQEKKKEIESRELLEAFQQSKRSYEEVIAFLKSEEE